jgi:HAD superfamily hydrolase (TIGR01484 family)
VNKNKYTKKHIAFQGISAVGADGDGELPDGNKVLFCGDAPRLEELAKYLEGMRLDGCRYVSSAPLYLEILPEGISKGSAVKALADLLGVSYDRIMGIGDYYNDLELIQTAAVGAAPSGAPEVIRQAADIVVGRSEDGAVADFIEYLEGLFGT